MHAVPEQEPGPPLQGEEGAAAVLFQSIRHFQDIKHCGVRVRAELGGPALRTRDERDKAQADHAELADDWVLLPQRGEAAHARDQAAHRQLQP